MRHPSQGSLHGNANEAAEMGGELSSDAGPGDALWKRLGDPTRARNLRCNGGPVECYDTAMLPAGTGALASIVRVHGADARRGGREHIRCIQRGAWLGKMPAWKQSSPQGKADQTSRTVIIKK